MISSYVHTSPNIHTSYTTETRHDVAEAIGKGGHASSFVRDYEIEGKFGPFEWEQRRNINIQRMSEGQMAFHLRPDVRRE